MNNKDRILKSLDFASFYQSHIPSLKVNGKPEVLGLCPFHDDHNASLSVNVESGLYRCFACDAKGDVFTFFQELKGVDFPTALKEIGEMAGMTNTDVKPKVVAKFEYKDVNGQVLYTKERIEPGREGHSKEFIFKHLENGKWVFWRGCDPVLYRLPELVGSKACIVVEGEAKADLLTSWGLPATCLDSGASSPIRDEHVQILSGMKKIIILPDNDKPGKAYAIRIANALHGKAGELRIVSSYQISKRLRTLLIGRGYQEATRKGL
ncbi:MAG: CHC2 zinc finger domain-containing protein [Candidatus Jettenia caeni]|nr:MAG: CHC2 zinc finger domain-containing protein [Candidatus Jettenia caeni]